MCCVVAHCEGPLMCCVVAHCERTLLYALQLAIANAKSLEEVRQLELQLQSGQLPVTQAKGPLQGKQNGQIVEEDEDDEEGEQEQMQT